MNGFHRWSAMLRELKKKEKKELRESWSDGVVVLPFTGFGFEDALGAQDFRRSQSCTGKLVGSPSPFLEPEPGEPPMPMVSDLSLPCNTPEDAQFDLCIMIPESIKLIQASDLEHESSCRPGEIGKATLKQTNEEVIIKSIPICDEDQTVHFVSELMRDRICAAHPSFPTVKGWMRVIADDGSPHGKVVMEYCGRNLSTFISEVEAGTLPRPSARDRVGLMLDYAGGMSFLHNVQNSLHGNLHPGSLSVKMLSENRIEGYISGLGYSKNINNPDNSGYTKNYEVCIFGMMILGIAGLSFAFPTPPRTASAERQPLQSVLYEFQRTGVLNISIPTTFDDFDDDHSSALRRIIFRCLGTNHCKRGSMEIIFSDLRKLYEGMVLTGAQPVAKARFFPWKCFSISKVEY